MLIFILAYCFCNLWFYLCSYAFSPLLDNPDDESVEPMLNDAFDGMKMRGEKNPNGSTSTASRKQGDKSKAERDKFVCMMHMYIKYE